jgi:hypothetical protein
MSDVESLRRVKSLVANIVLEAVLSEAQADEFVVVRRGSLFHMEVLASRSDSDWGQLGDATTGLREALSVPGSFAKDAELNDGRHCLIVKVEHPDGPLAACLVRETPFGEARSLFHKKIPAERAERAENREVIHRLVRSVLLAGDDHNEILPLVIVDVQPHPFVGFRSTVAVDRPDSQPAMAINSDAVVATATAATALAESSVSLRFAAQTSLEDGIVTIVLVEADDGGPIFGVSLDPGSGESGPVAAVFRAASFISADALSQV